MTDTSKSNLPDFLQEFSPETVSSEILRAGEDWADCDAAASSLEESKKSLLARLTIEYMEQGVPSGKAHVPNKPMTQSQAETRALMDDRYKAHLAQMVLARKEANKARVKYDTSKIKAELMRSVLATLRQELYMNKTGM